MASTARTSLSSMLSQGSRMPALMRGQGESACLPICLPACSQRCFSKARESCRKKILLTCLLCLPVPMPCTCSSSRLLRPASSLRFQSTSAASAASLSTSAIMANSSNTTRRANTQLTPKGTQPVQHDTSSALSLLRSQPSHYIIASLYQRRFLLTPRDLLTVPRLKDVNVGDVIRLDKIHEVGSRDYTLRASDGQFLNESAVHVRATVVEHTKGKMEETVKFKKRKGYKKTIRHKGKYTRLRVGEIVLGEVSQ